MAKNVKGFFRDPTEVLIRLFPLERITPANLEGLFNELTKKGISDAAVRLLAGRAAMSNRQRLLVNLSALIKCVQSDDVSVVVPNGLSTAELQALQELQDANIAPELMAVAHGLFNIHDRSAALEFIKNLVREVVLRGDSQTKPKLP